MSLTWEEIRRRTDQLSDKIEDWQGVPVLLGAETPVAVHDRHPLRSVLPGIQGVELGVVVGGPELADDEDEEVVNTWEDRRRGYRVWVFRRKPSGMAFALKEPLAPGGAMDRMALWIQTMGASDAWDEAAEGKARRKLRALLSDRQWRMYDLTGSFMETSKRSGVLYVFRRLRPTVAMSQHWWTWTDERPLTDSMRCLAVLCMHPVGYYERSWGGCMVPSDDVIAHLLHMRADESGFWSKANQHRFDSPEAGL